MGNFDPYLILFNFYDKFADSAYFKLGIALFFVFIFIILFSLVRKHLFKISMKGAAFGFFLGIVVMIIINLVIILGLTDNGKVQKLIMAEKRGQAAGEVLLSGFSNLGNVLGVSSWDSPQKAKTAQEVVNDFLTLPQDESQKVRHLFCPK